MTEYTQFDLLRQAVELFGDDPRFIAFTCPRCGDVACAQDFIDAGARADNAGQQCIGRVLGALDGPARDDGRGRARRGCDWTANGMVCGPWRVLLGTGEFMWSFRFATREEAERAGIHARRDAHAGSAADYVAGLRRVMAAYGLAEAVAHVPEATS